MFESERVWMGTKCTRSDVLNQPWIESVWCVYLSELEQVLTGASGSCCMNHRSSNLHEEKTTCYNLMFWSLTSLGTVQLLFKKVSLQISTNWVWDMQGFRSRSTSSTHCMGNLWFAPSLHPPPPPHIGTLWPSLLFTFVVKSVLLCCLISFQMVCWRVYMCTVCVYHTLWCCMVRFIPQPLAGQILKCQKKQLD